MATLINNDLFDDKLIGELINNRNIRNLEFTNKSNSVGVATNDEKFISYITGEKGEIVYAKRFNVFLTALISSRNNYDDLSYVMDRIQNESKTK